ncbi:MAG: cupin domain-containing protein [Solirubrobacterales bacterium]|nr:cupin domain-containing protein [Solirubrobacterales bacterium]
MQVVDRADANVRGWTMAMSGVSARPRVVDANAVPESPSDGDPLTVRATLGPQPLAQQVLACATGRSRVRATDVAEEVLFVISGAGVLRVNGVAHQLECESGAHLKPGETYVIENRDPEPLELVAVRISPRPRAGASGADAGRSGVRKLADQQAQDATAAREFRIVADPATGLASATHFVGYIPVGRAPDHFHTYDEVIYVLDGEGALLAEGVETPVTAGSCIELPARVVHCLENKGPGLMRVVGVFTPAGSPAAAYYPDGTPAHAAAPRLEAP